MSASGTAAHSMQCGSARVEPDHVQGWVQGSMFKALMIDSPSLLPCWCRLLVQKNNTTLRTLTIRQLAKVRGSRATCWVGMHDGGLCW